MMFILMIISDAFLGDNIIKKENVVGSILHTIQFATKNNVWIIDFSHK